ncbi:MAG: YihY/virulence factor BrkB family protein [Chloroflexi bacterium]|nr:YihY/virulence factor BrkB family protein [Chloroflexota bacterium]
MRLLRPLGVFFLKVGGDWSFALATLLAYNFLTAIFPLFLGVLALAALFLPAGLTRQVADLLSTLLPPEVTGSSGLNLNLYSVLTAFRSSSGITATVSLLGFVWTGSNLFSAMENCFSIIFRVRGRHPVRQKLMSIGMVLLFAVFAPLAVLSTTISSSVPYLLARFGAVPHDGVLVAGTTYLVSAVLAFVLFLAIYVIVPNRPMRWGEVWAGALIAAVLFVIVNSSFPVYASRFMIHAWFGRVLLVLSILALWFWVTSVILIIGAQVNAVFLLKERPLDVDLAGAVCRVAAEQRTRTDEVTLRRDRDASASDSIDERDQQAVGGQ